MWVMTPRGFYSVVQHRDEPTKVMVRGRCEADLNAVVELIHEDHRTAIEHTPRADYPVRFTTSAVAWASAVSQMVLEIDYDNFKNAVTDAKHHNAYSRVWGVLHSLEDSDSALDEDYEAAWEDYDRSEGPGITHLIVGDDPFDSESEPGD